MIQNLKIPNIRIAKQAIRRVHKLACDKYDNDQQKVRAKIIENLNMLYKDLDLSDDEASELQDYAYSL